MKKTYRLGGHKIKLRFPFKFKKEDAGTMGQCLWDQKEIRLICEHDGHKFGLSSLLQGFFHELVHAISFYIGREDIFTYEDGTNDDGAVDAFAEALTDFLLSNKLLNPDWLEQWKEVIEK